MNKELGRKITSLTLMTIMLTWSAAMGFSGSFMPEAEAANQYLWVSAENAENGNTFYGGQVLEVIVTDPAINRLDENYGMPDVTIDGKKVMMAQAVDGSWYAYVADATYANTIDALYVDAGVGADYGRFSGSATTITYNSSGVQTVTALTMSDAVGVTFNGQIAFTSTCQGSGSYSQGDAISACDGATPRGNHTLGIADGTNATADGKVNVIREPRALNNVTTPALYGNIALSPAFWPMIQLYDFTDDQVVDIDYNRGSGTEEVDLIFIDNAIGINLDKERFGLGHEVGVELVDWNLNIDPTDEDSWTFATNPSNASAFYGLFDENGASVATAKHDGTNANGAVINDPDQMSGTWGIPGIITIDRDGAENASANVTNFQTNADADAMVCSASITSGSTTTTAHSCSTDEINAIDQAFTMTETGANTGHFVNWDDAMKTNLVINNNAARGTTCLL